MPAAQTPASGVQACRARRPGFTLVELLVAMMISLVIVTVVVYVFSQVQRTTGLSMAQTQLTAVGTTIESRLRMDFLNMMGPDRNAANKAGCIVIVPATRQGYIPLPTGQMSANKVRLRQDQLVFISNRDPAQAPPWNNPDAKQSRPWVSLDPQDQNNTPVGATPSATTSWEAKIWYGPAKNGNYAAGDGSNKDMSLDAHLWMFARQAKLMTGGAGIPDVSVDVNSDTAAGTLLALKNDAVGWTDDAYVTKLAVKPASKTDFTNQPVATPSVDLKALQGGANISNGLQIADVTQGNLALCSNCSEVVIQWAGDLDKDGKIDVYPIGHPLAGSIIWYPEELHDKGAAWYNGGSGPLSRSPATTRMSSELAALYNNIRTNDWSLSGKTFPSGFAPALAAWPNGRFGALPATGKWVDRFQYNYGERDNAPNQATAPDSQVPEAYVFRFDDDQYRLARYGFRQDGGVYANKWDGKPLPGSPAGGKHWFPYPPNPSALTVGGINGAGGSMGYSPTINPSFPQLYAGRAAPMGPYPRTATPAGAVNANFGDAMGAAMLPVFWWRRTEAVGMSAAKNITTTNDQYIPLYSSDRGRKLNHTRFRTSGNGIPGDPGEKGYLIRIALANPSDIPPLPYKSPPTVTLSYEPPPPSFSTAVTPPAPPRPSGVLYTDDEPYPDQPVGPYSATRMVATGQEMIWPYRQGNNLVAINQMGDVLSTLALDADDLKTEPAFTSVYNPTLAGAFSSALSGPGPLTGMSQSYAADNNYTANYTDLWAEYLKNLNAPAAAYDPKADWRNPQSDWPRLIRVRLRLHDDQAKVTSYSDEFTVNARDDDGDGVVDNPEEGRISGLWFEYVFSVPYPHDPAPRNH